MELEMTTTPLRVFIVEDDSLTRETLAEALNNEPGFSVVGTAGSPDEAMERLPQDAPELVLVDLGLPPSSAHRQHAASPPPGVTLISDIQQHHPNILRMAHTALDQQGTVFAAIKAGAQGYVLKGCATSELASALQNLHEGGAPMTPRIARMVLQEFASQQEPDPLTPRERQILRHVDAGLTYKEIAAEENVSVHTVHSHIKNIYERLSAVGKRDALAKARQRGWLNQA